MNWSHAAQPPSDKVRMLLDAFNAFINDNHKTNKDEDTVVRTEWSELKKLLENRPFDMAALEQHVKNMKTEDMRDGIKFAHSVRNIKSRADLGYPTPRNPKKEVNKDELKKITKDLIVRMCTGNQKYFN